MAAEGLIIDLSDEHVDLGLRGRTKTETNVKFEDSFWGQECRGFEILLNNLKGRASASHYIGEYIKERITVEKNYIKGLQKLSKSFSQVNDSTLGSLHPLWMVVLKTLDDVCNNRIKHMNSLADINKEINDYTNKQDELLKKNMKGEIDSAHKSLVNYRHSIEIVKKTRKTYRSSCNDVGEIQQDIQRIKDDTSKTKDIERLEGKLKKAHGQMEHAKSEHEKSINAYHKQWSDFEEKMTEACKKFQSFDEEHVGIVRKIVIKITTCHETCERELYHDFTKLKDKMEMFPVKKLMEIFIQLKGTGTTKPELLQFSPIKVQSLKLPISSGGNVTTPPASDVSNTSVAATLPTKKEKKTKKKKKASSKKGNTDEPEDLPTPTNENVDEEGFTIRPKDAEKITKFSDEDSHSSDSDPESDFEAEAEKRIQGITIKQAASTSATVDEISKVAKNLKLEPVAATPSPRMHRAGSTQSLDVNSSLSTQRHASPIGSQSLYNQPIDPPPPPILTSPTLTTPPTTTTSQFPITTWEATFNDSFLPPLDILTSLEPLQSIPTLIPPPSMDNTSSLDIGVRTKTADPPPPSGLISLPPSSVDALKKQEKRGIKSEPSSPLMSVRSGVAGSNSPMLMNKSDSSPVASIKHLSKSSTSFDNGNVSLSPLVTASLSMNKSTTTTSSTSIASTSTSSSSSLVIPIAVAFQETCNAIFKGSDLSKTIVKVTGKMDFSFPSNVISKLPMQSPLNFKLTNTSVISKLLHNQNLLNKEQDDAYIFQMDKLTSHLKQQINKSALPFQNITALKYEVDVGGKSNTMPLQMTSFWKCDPSLTTFRLDYTYTPNVFPLLGSNSSRPTLTNFTISVMIGGGVTRVVDTMPPGTWSADKNTMIWKLPDISPTTEISTMTLKAKFEIAAGPTIPSPATVQFICDGNTLSGVDMMLDSFGYKLSLKKNKCITGKYIAEPLK